MQDFWVSFLTVAAAELGDKTQLALILLAARYPSRLKLLLGALLGFAVVDSPAVIAGQFAARWIPVSAVQFLSAMLFIAFGVLLLFLKEESAEKDHAPGRGAFLGGFILIAVSEWGDKTQIASALLASRFNPWLAWGGVMAALGTISLAAVFAGGAVNRLLPRKTIGRLGGWIFLLTGAGLLLAWILNSKV